MIFGTMATTEVQSIDTNNQTVTDGWSVRVTQL